MKYFLFTQKTLLLNIKYSNGEDNRHIDYNSVRDLAWGGGGVGKLTPVLIFSLIFLINLFC